MSDISFREYDADRIFVGFGPLNLTGGGGLAEDTFVTVKFASPLYVEKVGVDGTRTRSRTNDKRFTLTLVVMQSSDVNLWLSAAVFADLALNNGAGVTAMTLKDLSGSTLLFSPFSYVAELPEAAFARAANERAYVINGSWVGQPILGQN